MHVAHIDPHWSRMKRMSRTVVTSARMHQQESNSGGFRSRCWMATLTYAPNQAWKSDDIAKCLTRMRDWLKARGHQVRYVWKLELTKAGVPHYHVLLWLPTRLRCPMFDKRGWWPWGMTNTKQVYAATKYAAKYCQKGVGEGKLPKGARINGQGGLSWSHRLELRYWNAPAMVKQNWNLGEKFVRVAGGFLNLDRGEYLESPWQYVGCRSGGAVLVKKQLLGNIKISWAPVALAG